MGYACKLLSVRGFVWQMWAGNETGVPIGVAAQAEALELSTEYGTVG